MRDFGRQGVRVPNVKSLSRRVIGESDFACFACVQPDSLERSSFRWTDESNRYLRVHQRNAVNLHDWMTAPLYWRTLARDELILEGSHRGACSEVA
jgi:hypothetical protein